MSGPEYEVLMSGLSDESLAPKGDDVLYRCTNCGGIIPSIPEDNVGCICGNVFIDIDAFRLDVDNPAQFEAIRKRNR